MINIPIYRAKNKIRDDYIVGYYDQQREWKTKCNKCNSLNTDSYHEDYSEYAECFNCGEKSYFHNNNWIHDYQGEIEHLIRNNGEYAKIDPTTLAIHFPDMLDSQGNKIFASLNEDGKGGDIVEIGKYKMNTIFENGIITFNCEPFSKYGAFQWCNKSKTIGIKQ